MSEEVRTKIPVDFSSGKYARPWQTSQEELVCKILKIHSLPPYFRAKTYYLLGCIWWFDEKKGQLSVPWICYEQWAYLFRSLISRSRWVADELDSQGWEGTCYRKKNYCLLHQLKYFKETYVTRYYSWEAGSLVAKWTVWLPAQCIVQTSTGLTTQLAHRFVASWVSSSSESSLSRISM